MGGGRGKDVEKTQSSEKTNPSSSSSRIATRAGEGDQQTTVLFQAMAPSKGINASSSITSMSASGGGGRGYASKVGGGIRGNLKKGPASASQTPAELQIMTTAVASTADWPGGASGGRGSVGSVGAMAAAAAGRRRSRCCLSCLQLFASVVFSALGTVCLLLLYVLGCAVIFNSIDKEEPAGN